MLTDNQNAPWILLVEDDDSHAALMKESLQDAVEEYRLEIAGNLRDTRAALERQTPNLVLTDFRLPDGDGSELVAAVRGLCPVIMLTSQGNEQVAVDAMKAGVLDYVVKSPAVFSGMSRIVQRGLREWASIQEQNRAKEALLVSEARYHAIVEDQTDLICRYRPDGRLSFVNGAYLLYFGKKQEEVMGRQFIPHIPEPDISMILEQIRGITLDKPIVNFEHRVIMSDGKVCWQSWVHRGIYSPEGNLIEYQAVGRDITERKQMEEEKLSLERHLLHLQKLESLGTMSGGIAHDFNNLLMAVLGNLELSLMKLPQDTPVRNFLSQAVNAVERAAKLSGMMLAYSGKGVYSITEQNLTGLIEKNISMLAAAISKSITFDLKLDQNLPPIMADADQIRQVVVNLINNASESIGNTNGLITLSTGVQEFDQKVLNSARLEEKLAAGRYVWMEVSDSGCGMDAVTMDRLFDPFFTTKFTGRGLGMSVAQGIMRAHKGAILVESSPGGGSAIRVLFPIAAGSETEQASAAEVVDTVSTDVRPADIALIVDDEEMIRDVCTTMLGALGFKTVTADGGEEALRIFREQGERINMVLLDYSMPGMDGIALFRALRIIRPDLPVLLASGYSEEEVAERFKGLGLNGFIQKPFNLKRLGDEVRRVLEG